MWDGRYVGWLSCLDDNADARHVDLSKSVGTVPNAGETGLKRRDHRQAWCSLETCQAL
jgi:hypothetical protein